MKIRYRLAIQFSLLVAIILLAFSILIYILSANYRKQEFISRLKERAINTAKLLIDVKEVGPDILHIIDSSYSNTFFKDEVVVYDFFKRNMIYKSVDSLSIEINEKLLNTIMQQEDYYFTVKNREALGILYTNGLRRFIVINSAVDNYGHSKVKDLWIILFIGLIISIILTIVAATVFSKQALRSFSKIIKQVSKITASNLNIRVDEGNGEDEVAELAITFNTMLDRLEKAFKLQKSFVSNASHELRTPLASLTNQIEVALLLDRSIDEYKAILNTLLLDTYSINSLTNNLLEIARTEQDLSSLKLNSIRIDELLLQIQSEFSQNHHNNTFEFAIIDNSNELNEPCIYANENLIRQVFINIIDNAYKFSNNSLVTVNLILQPEYIQVTIIDKGIGISEEDLQHVFEPFYRASNAQYISGHGIGLSLISKIINMHNGKITINSVIDKGTTINVFFNYFT